LNGYELELRGISLLVLHGEGINLCGASEGWGNSFDVDATFELFAGKADPFTELLNIYRRPLELTSLSALNVGRSQSGIKGCDENDTNSWSDRPATGSNGYSREAYFLPTRLLSIGKADMDHVRLIPTTQIRSGMNDSERINYLALSYCWGSAEAAGSLLLTPHQTMDSWLQGIKIDTMPQVFKDAITIAHKLDIQYLWIDSLCIIQNDPPDWQKESSKMAEIFSNAYLTMAAAQGSSCNDTFVETFSTPRLLFR
jgi:hypothetical protein